MEAHLTSASTQGARQFPVDHKAGFRPGVTLDIDAGTDRHEVNVIAGGKTGEISLVRLLAEDDGGIIELEKPLLFEHGLDATITQQAPVAHATEGEPVLTSAGVRGTLVAPASPDEPWKLKLDDGTTQTVTDWGNIEKDNTAGPPTGTTTTVEGPTTTTLEGPFADDEVLRAGSDAVSMGFLVTTFVALIVIGSLD